MNDVIGCEWFCNCLIVYVRIIGCVYVVGLYESSYFLCEVFINWGEDEWVN